MRALEKAGIIAGCRALPDAAAPGFTVTLFAFAGLKSQAEAELRAFAALVAQWPWVREAHAIPGEADFPIKLVARGLPPLQNDIIRDLTSAPNVENVKTTLMLRVAKHEPGVPIA